MVKKTVSARKLAANRNNARRSTGPSTEWGKSNSRLNALKSGLFAEGAVIPDCDGENACQDFSELLLDLQQEFEPVGRFENALVEKIGECLWRLRRATRAENGTTRVGGFWDRSFKPPEGSFIDELNRRVDPERVWLKILTQAKDEITQTGKLSAKIYKTVRAFVEGQPGDPSNDRNSPTTSEPATGQNSEATAEPAIGKDSGTIADPVNEKNPDTPSEPVVDKNPDTTPEPVIDGDFVERIEEKIELLQFAVLQVDSRIATRIEDTVKQGSLPSAEEMERIYRCRMRTEKEIDWALGKLFFLQNHRKHKKKRR